MVTCAAAHALALAAPCVLRRREFRHPASDRDRLAPPRAVKPKRAAKAGAAGERVHGRRLDRHQLIVHPPLLALVARERWDDHHKLQLLRRRRRRVVIPEIGADTLKGLVRHLPNKDGR